MSNEVLCQRTDEEEISEKIRRKSGVKLGTHYGKDQMQLKGVLYRLKPDEEVAKE